MFHDGFPDARQVLKPPRVIEAVMDRLVRQGRHLIEMGSQPGLFFDIQQEGVLHPFDHGLGRGQALQFQRRGAAIAEKIHPPQGPGPYKCRFFRGR